MAAPQAVVQAVQAAIVASAHLAAYEHVSAAAMACQRLGGLTSGRWRSVARDLDSLEDELQTAFASAADALTERATSLGVNEETLWTAGDAAATLDLLRESALGELDDDSPAARLLQGNVLFGASFIEDPDLPDRGTTLLFGWPEPLAPATWPWQANWVVGNGQEDDAAEDELDLFESGDVEGEESLLGELADELRCSRDEARTALRDAALAVTRASLLANVEREEEEAIDDQAFESNPNDDNNGER
ncbi:MAG TPA: hypothetical protein VFG86_20485 [Chloroflexota bacterium]|jgi:hypothetical protein|nr:hypothetical protein [Chloroflexota bacterium]